MDHPQPTGPCHGRRIHELIRATGCGLGRLARASVGMLVHPWRAWKARRAEPPPSASRSTPRPDAEEPLAAFAAARLAADDGLNALAQALGDPEPRVRILALEVVCEFSTERAACLLAAMIHDPEVSVRCAAAAAAARLGAARTVSSLMVALDDPEPAVRVAATRAIETITGRSIPVADPPDREQIEELKRWWKTERLAQLSASLPGDSAP